MSRLLGYGFALSLVWLGGVGSLIAFILGLKALRVIKQSNSEISGVWVAWWCVIVGGAGMVILLPILILAVINGTR